MRAGSPSATKVSAEFDIQSADIAGLAALAKQENIGISIVRRLAWTLHRKTSVSFASAEMISALQRTPLPSLSAVVSPSKPPVSTESAFVPATTAATPAAASGSASPSGRLSAGTLDQLIQVQSQQSGASQGNADSAVDALIALGAKGAASGQISLNDNYKSTLFNLASGNSGTLTRSDLEKSVVAGGGTAQDADALFDQIDRNGSGAVSENEMAGQLASCVKGDSFGASLSSYLQTNGDLQQTLMQQLMKIGLTQDEANSLAGQMKSSGTA